jgi:hypothetical protein
MGDELGADNRPSEVKAGGRKLPRTDATFMGRMGRSISGSYAELTDLPATNVLSIPSLNWSATAPSIPVSMPVMHLPSRAQDRRLPVRQAAHSEIV